MIIRPATDADIAHIVHWMRDADAAEVFSDRFDKTEAALIADIIAARKISLAQLALCCDKGCAIALLGAILAAPARANVQMIATDRWSSIAAAATRYTMRHAIPVYLGGVRRAECRVWEGNEVSRRWLDRLGFACEAVMPQHDTNGASFLLYARLHPDFRVNEGSDGRCTERRPFLNRGRAGRSDGLHAGQ